MGFTVTSREHGVMRLSLRMPAGEERRSLKAARYELLSRRVSDAMTREVVTVGPETPLRDVEALFEQHGFNGVPVVDGGGALLGFLSKLDMLRAFAFSTLSIVPH